MNNDVLLKEIETIVEKKLEILKQDLSNLHPEAGLLLASQATLAKRYDMSKSTLCRILQCGERAGKIHPFQIEYGERKSNKKYIINEADEFVIPKLLNGAPPFLKKKEIPAS